MVIEAATVGGRIERRSIAIDLKANLLGVRVDVGCEQCDYLKRYDSFSSVAQSTRQSQTDFEWTRRRNWVSQNDGKRTEQEATIWAFMRLVGCYPGAYGQLCLRAHSTKLIGGGRARNDATAILQPLSDVCHCGRPRASAIV